MSAIRVKFVRATGLSAYLIAREGLPWGGFSHVAALLSDGTLIDARSDKQECVDGVKRAGVRNRVDNYEAWTRIAVVEIPVSSHAASEWEGYLRSKIGDPYDSAAIWGFALGLRLHKRGHFICSALEYAAQHRIGLIHSGHRPIFPASAICPDVLFAIDSTLAGARIVQRYGF